MGGLWMMFGQSFCVVQWQLLLVRMIVCLSDVVAVVVEIAVVAVVVVIHDIYLQPVPFAIVSVLLWHDLWLLLLCCYCYCCCYCCSCCWCWIWSVSSLADLSLSLCPHATTEIHYPFSLTVQAFVLH